METSRQNSLDDIFVLLLKENSDKKHREDFSCYLRQPFEMKIFRKSLRQKVRLFQLFGLDIFVFFREL